MKNPKVSIITPTFNRAAVLPRTAKSVFSQSFRDFEWILVDDGSTDETAKVVQNFADPRVVFVASPKNGGQNAARNLAEKFVRGKWVVYLDSDDTFFDETTLEMMVSEAEKMPKKVAKVNFPVVAESGIKKSFLKSDRMRLSLRELLCRSHTRGEFVCIQRAETLKMASWPEKFSGVENLRHFRVVEKYDSFYINRPALRYFDNNADNETSGDGFLKKIDGVVAGTEKFLARYRKYYKKWCPRRYGENLAKWCFLSSLSPKYAKNAWKIWRAAFAFSAPKSELCALFFWLFLPISWRRFLFSRGKKFIRKIY